MATLAPELSAGDYLTIISMASGFIVFIATYVWLASQWLAKQFVVTRALIDSKIEKLEDNIVTKLEYHEKHDDQRFDSLHNDIWDIRVRNAARDGRAPLIRKEK